MSPSSQKRPLRLAALVFPKSLQIRFHPSGKNRRSRPDSKTLQPVGSREDQTVRSSSVLLLELLVSPLRLLKMVGSSQLSHPLFGLPLRVVVRTASLRAIVVRPPHLWLTSLRALSTSLSSPRSSVSLL